METIKEVLKNKLKSIISLCENYKEKIENDPLLGEKIQEYAEKHNISNMSLLRRFANPVKDPDPLASTMIALSYKYPLIMKSEYINTFPLEVRRKYIDTKSETRRVGWVGCKKEIVNYYLTNAPDISKEQKEIVDVLYKTEREKVKSYNNIDWEKTKLHLGMQLKTRDKVKTQIPFIPGIKQSMISELICKILTPDMKVSQKIQDIYEKNKEKFGEAIPKHVSITEQAAALRNILDSKERYLPILQSKMPREMYQHATGLFSVSWQLSDVKYKREESSFKENLVDVESLCNMFISCLEKSDDPLDYLFVCKNLYYREDSLYDILHSDESMNSMNINYVKALCHLPSYNIIHYEGKMGVICDIYPMDFIRSTSGQEDTHVLHFKTAFVGGVCHLQKNKVDINIKWTTYLEIREIYFLFKFIQMSILTGKDMRASLRKMDFSEAVRKNATEEKLENYLIDRAFRLTEKSSLINKMKDMSENIYNRIITTGNCSDRIVINDLATNAEPKQITQTVKNSDALCIFAQVNNMPLINFSWFVNSRKTEMQYFTTNLQEGNHPFIEYENANFLNALLLENRLFTLMSHCINNISVVINNIMRRNFSRLGSFFLDCLSIEQIENLGFVCNGALSAIEAKSGFSETAPELISFYYIWASEINTHKIITQYPLCKKAIGYMIDLDFSPSNQNEKNLLWVDEENTFRSFSERYSKAPESMQNYTKMLVIQSRYNKYRIEVHNTDDEPEKIYDIENALRKLDAGKDGEYLHVNHLGLVLKVTRDRDFLMKTNSSYNRTLRGLKRSMFFETSTMDIFSLGPQSKKRRTQ